MFRSLAALCLALLVMPALGTGPRPAAPPFVTAEALTDWLAHHPSPLDQAPPHARALFLDALDFGPRGVRSFPHGELASDLTTAELAEVQRLLLDEAMPLPGLEVDEARRLRAARASGALAGPSEPVLATYREWRRALEPTDVSGAAIDRLAAEQAPAGSEMSEDLRLLHRAALERGIEFHDDARIDTARALHARLDAQAPTNRQQWPVALDTTPQFLVFRDGQLFERVGGWRRDGSDRDPLPAALARAGLLRSTADSPVPATIGDTTPGHR